MMIDEDYACSDGTFEPDDPDDNMDIVPEEFRHVVLYREFDTLGSHAAFKQKSRRRRWTQRDMTNAYNAVKYQGMSLRGAATAFNVPESTLRDRVHGRVSLECSRPGPPTFFTFEEEKKMVDHILFMSKIGYPYTRNQVVELAGDMTKAVGRIAPFKYLNPSQAWFYAFLNRWPDLKNFLFGPRTNRKSKGVSGDAIQAYFEQLDKVLTKYGIKDKPEHVWVVDEVSISCENQPPRILPIGIQRAQSVTYWSPTVAIIGAASANGEKIPPFLIYRGESITTDMMEGAVRGSKFANSPSGWVNSDAFIQWFLKHFRPAVAKRPLVLLYDGHLQFVSVRVLERAREDGVLLFPLPPHPAYNHCVENTCFLAFQNYFEKRLERFFQKFPNQPLSKMNVAPVLTHAYERALQPQNMIRLFDRLGICPFNNLSSSIGAYLNIPDDFDQDDVILTGSHHPENGLGITAESSEGSMPHWGGRNSGASAASPYAFHEAAAMGLMAASPSIATPMVFNRPQSATSQFLVAPPTSASDLKPEESLPGSTAAMATEPVASQSTTRVRLVPASGGGSGRAMKLVTFPPQRAGHISIRMPGIGGGHFRPVIIKHAGASNTTPISTTASSITMVTTVSDVPPANHNLGEDYDQEVTTYDALVEISSATTTITTATPPTPVSTTTTNVAASELPEDEEGGEGRLVEDIEEGEAPGICAVCCQLEPPGFDTDADNGDSEYQVVDWAHCDYCNRWVHLNSECSRNAIIGDDAFMCALCREEHDGTCGGATGTPMTEDEAVIAAPSTHFEASPAQDCPASLPKGL